MMSNLLQAPCVDAAGLGWITANKNQLGSKSGRRPDRHPAVLLRRPLMETLCHTLNFALSPPSPPGEGGVQQDGEAQEVGEICLPDVGREIHTPINEYIKYMCIQIICRHMYMFYFAYTYMYKHVLPYIHMYKYM